MAVAEPFEYEPALYGQHRYGIGKNAGIFVLKSAWFNHLHRPKFAYLAGLLARYLVRVLIATTEPAEEPSLVRREIRAFREPFRLLAASLRLHRAPRGSRGVIVVPGFSTSDTIMVPLRSYLRGRGHTVWGWELGVNRGEVDLNLPRVVAQVERRVAENNGAPITMVGWSFGGVFAREVARARPELVEQLVTLASPVRNYRRSAQNTDVTPIETPITAFYSKRDGVVAWQGAIDKINPNVDMIEVASSHVGITLDSTVWLNTAELLAT